MGTVLGYRMQQSLGKWRDVEGLLEQQHVWSSTKYRALQERKDGGCGAEWG